MSGTIWSKFFWSDWDTDQALRLCSFAAQGFWMRMLCIAAAHDPIGYVAVAGKGLDETALARLTGCQESEAASLLGELERNGVFSRDRHRRIYSRRMVADARRAALARKNGRKGGNPTLSNNEENPSPDKGSDKSGHKPHKPSATKPDEKPVGFSGRAPARKKPPNWFSPKTATEAANDLIEELGDDNGRNEIGHQGDSRAVLQLPSVRTG